MPEFKFKTKIYHPNVMADTGAVCDKMLGKDEWVPTKKISGVIDILVTML